MNRKNFIRNPENFICEICGLLVSGDGYTDHCPACLWGKHVDGEVPGDRSSSCGGLMEPIALRIKGEKQQIKYQCCECGKTFFCKKVEDDNLELLLSLPHDG